MAKAPDSSRLINVEARLGTVEVTVARIDERLDAHMESATKFQADMREGLKTIAGRIEPLREARWKQAGATTVLGALSGAAVSIAVAALKLFR